VNAVSVTLPSTIFMTVRIFVQVLCNSPRMSSILLVWLKPPFHLTICLLHLYAVVEMIDTPIHVSSGCDPRVDVNDLTVAWDGG